MRCTDKFLILTRRVIPKVNRPVRGVSKAGRARRRPIGRGDARGAPAGPPRRLVLERGGGGGRALSEKARDNLAQEWAAFGAEGGGGQELDCWARSRRGGPSSGSRPTSSGPRRPGRRRGGGVCGGREGEEGSGGARSRFGCASSSSAAAESRRKRQRRRRRCQRLRRGRMARRVTRDDGSSSASAPSTRRTCWTPPDSGRTRSSPGCPTGATSPTSPRPRSSTSCTGRGGGTFWGGGAGVDQRGAEPDVRGGHDGDTRR